MNLLIFRTNIGTQKMVKSLESLFRNIPTILGWSVDLEDIDNVLRIEATGELEETDIINHLKISGFQCETLED